MLRSAAAAGVRGALRARTGAQGRAPLIQPAFQAFHAGIPNREKSVDKPAVSQAEEIEANRKAPLFGVNPRLDAIVEAGKLDGAKRLIPFALFLSVPALCREWYVITEETMLMGCFFLFLGAAMDFGGEGIGKYFADQTAAIKAAQTAAESKQIERVTAELTVEKGRRAEMQQIETIGETIASKDARRKEAEAMAAPHMNRDSTMKLLEGLKALKMKRVAELRAAEVATALDEVVSKISSDKKLKKAALDNALQALADPAKAAKVDPVSQTFAQYWKQKAADMEKNKDKTITLSDQEMAANEADVKAVFAKVGQDPSEFIATLPKKYTPSTPTLFS